MSQSPVNLSSGLPETVLPPVSPELEVALQRALAADPIDRRDEVAAVVATDPTYLDGWARLAELVDDDVEAYAYARVGYHRGLDALRRAGWRGNGHVRWREPSNQGFLRSLEALRRSASALGEQLEADRCDLFLRQLDPDWKGLPGA